MKAFAHIATVLVALALLVGVPVASRVDIGALAAGGVDTVSSSTQIQAAPSGTFTVLINRDLHPKKDVLEKWVDFFSGRDVPVIMEDVSCVAIQGDAAGIEMAQSLQSRLPENQMKLRLEGGQFAVSKAFDGRFDVLVMSDEVAMAYDAEQLYSLPNIEVVHR